jgi:hypothetical protein
MKYNKFFLAGSIFVASLSLGSCVGDLDLLPTDPSQFTPDQFAQDPEGYLDKAIAGVYMQYATYGANGIAAVQGFDGGMSTFQRAAFILEEIPTDEASWIAADTDYGLFQYGVIPTSNRAVMGTYSRFFINIAMCNQFMQTVNAGYFNLTTPELQAKADEYIRQARILRAGAYWYAIDNFGNVPWADESVQMGQVAPQLSTNFAEGRKAVYEKVVADLEDVVAWYKANDANNKPPYGYVGLDVAESLLVKYYLNAEVYSGTAEWAKCLEHAQAVIGRLGKGGFKGTGLCNNYFQNFGANNKDYTIGGAAGVNEIIWTIPQEQTSINPDGNGLMSYANATFMCNAWIGTSTDDDPFTISISDYNSGNGWKCIVARPEFVEKFDWNEDYSVSPDKRTQWWATTKQGFVKDNISLALEDWGKNGFLAVKYTNWAFNDNGVDEANSPTPTDQLGGDYAVIRLAEIYLSAAEAILNGGGSSNTQALEYVNYIRERAGMSTLTSLNLTQLQDERCRELYTENIRRSDLIRYGKWLSGYTWSWKYNVKEGSDYPASFLVYPIPSTIAARNGYVQNPNY